MTLVPLCENVASIEMAAIFCYEAATKDTFFPQALLRGEYNVQISKLFPYGFEKTFPQQIMWENSIFIFSLSSTI